MEYKLYYAKLELDEDIKKLNYKNFNDIIDFVREAGFNEDCQPIDGIVWLLTYNNSGDDEKTPIIIDACIGTILDHLEAMKLWKLNGEHKMSKCYDTYFLQAYKSYESAYKVALSMHEIDELCYD